MNTIVKASLMLVVVIAVVSLGFTFTGFQASSPILGGLLFLAIALLANFGVLFWGLSGTASSCGYGKQLLNSAIFGALAGVLIFAFSFLLLSVLAPDHLEQLKLATIESFEGMNMPPEALEKQVAAQESRTPMSEALGGLVGTFFTSLIFGAIISIFKRKK